MRIGFNGHILGGQSAGVQIYANALLKKLTAIDRENEYLLFGKPASLEPFRRQNVDIEASRFPTERRTARVFWEHFILPARAKKRGVEIFHFPDHVHPMLDCPCPSIITVHDVAFIKYPEMFDWSRRLYKHIFVMRSARKASRIIAVSEHTKHDLITLLDIPASKISVVHEAPQEHFRMIRPKEGTRQVRERYDLPERFILCVGTLEPRKNLKVLLKAYQLLLKKGQKDLPLVVVGRKGWLFRDIFRMVEALGLQDKVRFTGFVPGIYLPAFYSTAALFVYPSLYEGFGLPVLEAMACGAAVVTSNVSSIPEVAGDAAVMINPSSADDLAEAMWRVLTVPGLREELSFRGLARAKLFSWEETARRTLKVYKEAFMRGEVE